MHGRRAPFRRLPLLRVLECGSASCRSLSGGASLRPPAAACAAAFESGSWRCRSPKRQLVAAALLDTLSVLHAGHTHLSRPPRRDAAHGRGPLLGVGGGGVVGGRAVAGGAAGGAVAAA